MLKDCSQANLKRMRRTIALRVKKSDLPLDVRLFVEYMPINIKIINHIKNYEGLASYDNVTEVAYIHLAKWFVKKYSYKRILETLAHEFAHIIDFYIRKSNLDENKWHDKHWQKINWICGGDVQNYKYKPRKKK